MKTYSKPELDILTFIKSDVITASGGNEIPDGDFNLGDEEPLSN